MKYDEFEEQLKAIKADFLKATGKELTTIEELELYLIRRKMRSQYKTLKSIKGLNL